MDVLTVSKDVNCRFTQANDAWLRLAGFRSLDHALGKSDADCAWADFTDIYHQHELDALNGKHYGAVQPSFNAADNSLFWAYNFKYRETDAQGNPIAVHVIAHEIADSATQHFLHHLAGNDHFNTEQYLIDKPIDDALTERQIEILFYLLHMRSHKQIAELLGISKRTVDNHIDDIKLRLGLTTKSQLFDYAFAKGYVQIIPSFVLQKGLMKKLCG